MAQLHPPVATNVEGPSLLRSGLRRRSVLAANADTCDLYVLGGDRLLRIFHPKAASGALRSVSVLRPQLLDASFVHDMTPSFWHEPLEEQERLVRTALGADRILDVPYEVVEMRLHETSGLIALAGMHRVSIIVPPSTSRLGGATDAADELGKTLAQLGLTEYDAALRDKGYTHVNALLHMSATERETMMTHVGMRPGHAQTLAMHLEGRLPPASPALSVSAAESAQDRCAGRISAELMRPARRAKGLFRIMAAAR